MTGTPGYCAQCGAAHAGDRWCAQCGSALPGPARPADPTVLVMPAQPEAAARPVPSAGSTPPAGPRPPTGSASSTPRSGTLQVVLIVVVILALGVGRFVGARWWLGRDEAAVTPAPASTAPAEPPSANGTRPAKNADAPTGAPTTASVASTVIATATVTAVLTPAPTPTVAPVTTTAASLGTVPNRESIAGVVRHDVGFDKSYVVVLGSALDRNQFADTAAALGAQYPARRS